MTLGMLLGITLEDKKEIDRLHSVSTFLNKRFLRVLFDYIEKHEDVSSYTIIKDGKNMNFIITTPNGEMFTVYVSRPNFTDYQGKKFNEYLHDVLRKKIHIRRIDARHIQDFIYF